MSETDEVDEVDVVRAFTAALPPAAQHHLAAMPGYDQIRCIRAATETRTPAALARWVAFGIGWDHPANAPALLAWRLRRAAGLDTDPEQEN